MLLVLTLTSVNPLFSPPLPLTIGFFKNKKREGGKWIQKQILLSLFFIFSQLHNWTVQRRGGEKCSICFQFHRRYERSDKLLWPSQKLKAGAFFLSSQRTACFFTAETTQNELIAKASPLCPPDGVNTHTNTHTHADRKKTRFDVRHKNTEGGMKKKP